MACSILTKHKSTISLRNILCPISPLEHPGLGVSQHWLPLGGEFRPIGRSPHFHQSIRFIWGLSLRFYRMNDCLISCLCVFTVRHLGRHCVRQRGGFKVQLKNLTRNVRERRNSIPALTRDNPFLMRSLRRVSRALGWNFDCSIVCVSFGDVPSLWQQRKDLEVCPQNNYWV